MKKAILITVLALIITFSFSPLSMAGGVTRAADTQYEAGVTYRADNDTPITVYGRIDGVEYPLFFIPATYYFKVTDIFRASEGIFYIEYNGTTEGGLYYIKARTGVSLTDRDVEPLSAYTLPVTLSQDSAFIVHQSTNYWRSSDLLASTNPEITFLGFSTYEGLSQAAYCRVGVDAYGFIDVSALTVTQTGSALSTLWDNIPPHLNYTPQEALGNNDGDGTTNNDKLIRIILIVGIVVPALIIMFLLFKPSKKGRYDYERNTDYVSHEPSPYDRPRSRYRDDYDNRPRDNYPPRGRRDDYYDDDYDRYDDRRRY